MPCRSYPEDFPEEMRKVTQEKLDIVSRIACKALTHIEETGDGLEILILKDPELAKWWSAHKKADAEEQERVRAAAAKIEAAELRKQQKKDILARLSPEERKILGVK